MDKDIVEFTVKKVGEHRYEVWMSERRMCLILALTDLEAMERSINWMSSFPDDCRISWDVQPDYTHHE